MTGAARYTWVVLLQIAMQAGWVLQLGCDFRMAGYTVVGHAPGLPESGVAGGALSTQGGMGGYTAQRSTCLCIEGAWIEEYAAAHKSHHNYYQHGQQGRYQSRSSQAAKRFLLQDSTSSAATWRNRVPHQCE